MASAVRDRLPVPWVCMLAVMLFIGFAGCVRSDAPPEVFDAEPTSVSTVPVEVAVWADGDPAQPVPGVTVRILSGDSTLQKAMTDPEGIARFWMETGTRHVLGVAASGEGWTDERIDTAFQTSGSDAGTIETSIPVYHSKLTLNHLYDWEGPATVQPIGDRASVSEELGFSDDPALEHAYSRRVDTVTVHIEWENSPTALADFGVFIRGNADADEEERTVRSDTDQDPVHQGLATEEVTIDRDGLIAIVDTRSPAASYGIETKEPVVAPEGITVNTTVWATFRTPVLEVAEGPMLDPISVISALAILGMVGMARRRPETRTP